MKNKMFDCVQMKRRGAESVHKQLEGKSFEQQLEYWQKETDQLKEFQKQAKEKNSQCRAFWLSPTYIGRN